MRVQRHRHQREFIRSASKERRAMQAFGPKPEKVLTADRFGNVSLKPRMDSSCKAKGLKASHTRTYLVDVPVRIELTPEQKEQDSLLRRTPGPKGDFNTPMVRVGTTPERKLLIEDDDGKRKMIKIKAQPKFRPIGLSSSVPNRLIHNS